MKDNSPKLRVLRVIARMNVGGPAIQVTNLMQELPSDSFDQLLLTGYCGENEIDYLMTRQLSLNVEKLKFFGRTINPFSDIVTFFQIRNRIKEFNPDIIHTHTFKAGLLGRLAAFSVRPKARTVHTFHGHLLYGYFGILGTRLLITIERLLAKRTDILIAVGGKVRDELINAGIGSLNQYQIINPGFNLNPVEVIPKQEIGLPLKSFVCGWFGRITHIKRIDRLLEVAELCKRYGADKIVFLIVGDGELKSDFEREVTAKQLPILFLGWREDVSSLMQICDLVVCTSENEGTPISIIESQLLGKPVISTDVGSVREVMLPDKSGFAIDYDAFDFYSKITSLANDRKLYKEFAHAAYIFANQNFTLNKFIKNHMEVYRDVSSIQPIQCPKL